MPNQTYALEWLIMARDYDKLISEIYNSHIHDR
jgi:hypothetical protein